jgi:uncharacterized membrane protein YbaN (DUF454 family)
MSQNDQNIIGKDEINVHQNPFVKWVLVISGAVLVGIGVLGMFLPLLPTTVFFILAAWCFARSSEKFYIWLHTNRLFGRYLRNYRNTRGMTLRSKVFSISFLWIGILASALWGTHNLYIRILLIAIAIGVSWHLIAITTIKETE